MQMHIHVYNIYICTKSGRKLPDAFDFEKLTRTAPGHEPPQARSRFQLDGGSEVDQPDSIQRIDPQSSRFGFLNSDRTALGPKFFAAYRSSEEGELSFCLLVLRAEGLSL